MPKWHFFSDFNPLQVFFAYSWITHIRIHTQLNRSLIFAIFTPFNHLNVLPFKHHIDPGLNINDVQTIWILIRINWKYFFWNCYWIFSSSWGNLGKRVLNESYCFANYMIEQQLSSESRDSVSRYVFLTSILYLEILREITHDINIPIWISHQYIIILEFTPLSNKRYLFKQ